MIERIEDELDLLDRHLEVLELVVGNQPIGIVELSRATGYPRHQIRYSLRRLEERGVVEPTKHGARTTVVSESFVEEHGARFDAIARRLERMANRIEVPA